MARRSGGSHKCVEEKRRMLPIYQHYTLSPGRTKSHHPEAKCIHCLKEFVCGSKQRLIRHLRKCNSITNPEQIIAETLNTLARNSATGQLNHSILEASNLLPSQISHIHHSNHQQLVGISQQQYHPPAHHQQHHPTNSHSTSTSSSSSTNLTTASSNLTSASGSITTSSNDSNAIASFNNNTSGSSLANSESMIVPSSNSGSTLSTTFNGLIPIKKTRRGRKPANQHGSGSGIHVTTGLDGKTQFTPISHLPPGVVSSSPQLLTTVHNGTTRVANSYASFHQPSNSSTAPVVGPTAIVTHAANSGHHLHVTPFKLNPEPIDKAYLKLVITRNLPLSLCDTKEFQSWVKTFANDYKPPNSINLIAQNLKQEAQTARQRVSNILVKAPKKTVNLELHSWPDRLRGRLWFAIIAVSDNRKLLISVKDVIEQMGAGSRSENTKSHSNNDKGLCHSNNELNPNQIENKILSDFIDDCIKRVGSDRINSLMFSAKVKPEMTILARARHALYTNHPSIVNYYCWLDFTNQLCSDIMENDEKFLSILKSSYKLINFICKRPQLYLKLDKFAPFMGAIGTSNFKKDDQRWYSYLVCYLLDFIKNNHQAIIKALDSYNFVAEAKLSSSIISDDNNNNSSGDIDISGRKSTVHGNSTDLISTQQQKSRNLSESGKSEFDELKSIVISTEYWSRLDSALLFLKPFRDILALTPTTAAACSNPQTPEHPSKSTPVTNPSIQPSLSDYMHWFLNYGKSLFDSWKESPDQYKYNLIGHYVHRFVNSINDFKRLFAAYLLNPRYRCAYVTQKAKDIAIEEILNIASEFMPEESDGHTIFDQWKLYLIRDEPYDMAFDETRSNALDWWMSLPCAESIRRVALRILRLKAFSSPKPQCLFSQLHFYEYETKTCIDSSSYEDLAIIRYFYGYEDKIGSVNPQTASNSSFVANGFIDRANVGLAHNIQQHNSESLSNYLPSGGLNSISQDDSNDQFPNDTLTINESNSLRVYDEDVYMAAAQINKHLNSECLSLDKLPGMEQFTSFIDFNEHGIQVVEEPMEKKRRKWTAQEILSKCQSAHNNSVTVNNSSVNESRNNIANHK